MGTKTNSKRLSEILRGKKCPTCTARVTAYRDECPSCGQSIDWDDRFQGGDG
jgi:endogenous inhibitor of DNA gyrase (YacG/DUF329 family)